MVWSGPKSVIHSGPDQTLPYLSLYSQNQPGPLYGGFRRDPSTKALDWVEEAVTDLKDRGMGLGPGGPAGPKKSRGREGLGSVSRPNKRTVQTTPW